MEADEQTKNGIRALVAAIQMSVDSSPFVAAAVENLQRLGYIPKFTVRMDLDLQRPMDDTLTDTRVRLA